ncbi:MAG: YbaB/EbfC family nucleoid-associated protein [Armatimonadetes bacterium]|nr:YbaB/EbfC family nucleoid-associated protein [Armatimonadota bacterium]
MGGLGQLGNIGNLMKEAQKTAERMQSLEQELAQERIEASSGGGMVKATVTGAGQLLEINIDPKVVDPDDVEMLQDLIITAVRDGLEQATKIREERIQGITGGLNLPNIPGLPF